MLDTQDQAPTYSLLFTNEIDGNLVGGAGQWFCRTNRPAPSICAITALLDAGLVSRQSCFC
jgi:hypothetical protein